MNRAEDYIDQRSAFVAIDGLRVHYRREGAGPVILLLHGSGSSLLGFEALAARLTDSFEVVRMDLPGCGLTGPRPDRDYRIATFVEFVARFASQLALPRFTVAGNSLGGNIAWNLALDHPARVETLVLMNATGYPEKSLPTAIRLARNPLLRPLLRTWAPRRATEQSLRKLVGPLTRIDAAMVDRVHAMLSRRGNRAAFVDFANTPQADRSRDIPRIRAPTLVLRGACIDGQHFARDIPAAREIVYPDVGHLLPEEVPVEAAAAIRAHVMAALARGTSSGARA